MKVDDSKILFVNSLDGSGIGDFGKVLYSAIDSGQIQKTQIRTDGSWEALYSNWNTIFEFPGKILMNLGFTSYGKSSLINFINFLLIFLYSRLFAGKMQVILHDSPDLMTSETAGYKHFNFIKLGGAFATRLLSGLQVHVFSATLFSILKDKYGLKNVYFHPFPCLTSTGFEQTSKNERITVISIGYIAPYKGLELIPEIKKAIPEVDFTISGAPHPVLSKTVKGSDYLKNLTTEMKDKGVDVRGYIQEKEIRELTTEKRAIGILPYVTTSGSSYAATFLMERGFPVIASELREFRVLYEHGAGIILCDRTAENFVNTILKLGDSPELYHEQVMKNNDYCTKYSLPNLLMEMNI